MLIYLCCFKFLKFISSLLDTFGLGKNDKKEFAKFTLLLVLSFVESLIAFLLDYKLTGFQFFSSSSVPLPSMCYADLLLLNVDLKGNFFMIFFFDSIIGRF